MFRDAARSLLAEPRAPDPPARVWRDWALVAALVPVAVLEGVLKEDMVWRVASVVVALALLPTLLWRRTHPLAAVVVAFGLLTVAHVASLAVGADWRGLDTTVFVVLLIYSLLRWASGRHAVIGLAVFSIPVLLGGLDAPASNVVGGGLFMLAVAAVGVAVRYQSNARSRGMDQVKLLEREQLA
ncbi:MAG: sensor histidine kinase, partial [Acidimicrobiales bacterium]